MNVSKFPAIGSVLLGFLIGMNPLVSPVCGQQSLSTKGTASQSSSETDVEWNQWRGPNRDGILKDARWPESLDGLKKIWSVSLEPSYSGPIVVGDRVFTTQTVDKKKEVVVALDRKTGKVIWKQEWMGAMSVPFFAKANGDWIRATPAYSDGRLYVAGIRDVLVCLDAEDGKVIWKVDFPAKMNSQLPTFGMVCSPLIDGDDLYIQAGGGFCKLNKDDGSVIWRAAEDGGGMQGSAFSSPIITTIGGVRQAVIQSRQALIGVDLVEGNTLWSQPIKSFRGMNIITPTPFEDGFFVSCYGGGSQFLQVENSGAFQVNQKWKLSADGYMTTPVIIDGFAYTHLRNTRYSCFDLKNGKEMWRSKPEGKYASLVAAGDKILALDQRGILYLLKANPEKFDVLSKKKVGDDSWAHLAVRGNQVFVRNLNEMVAFEFEE